MFDLALLTQRKYLDKIESLGNVKSEILTSIYIGFGNTYFYKANYAEAIRYFEYAKDLQQADTKIPSYISTLYLIALCHTNIANYTEALQYCTMANTIMNDNKEAIADETRVYLNIVGNIIAIQAYSNLKDFKKAKAIYEQLPSDIDSSPFREQKDDYYLALSVYYASIKEYRAALKSVDLGLDHLKKAKKIITQPDFIKEKASLLYNMQNYEEAYTELLNATKLADSIRSSHSAIQLDELAITFELDLKDSEIAEANTQLKYTQTIIVALIIISLLLLLLILVFIINSRKQKAKNILLFKQQEELNKSIDYYKKIIAEDLQYNNTETNPLFLKLEEYMLQKEAYKKPDISRDEIASILHTNRQYLSSAIKDATGLTFTNYINKYRLEDAKRLLLEHDDITIDDIIIKSGFSSRPTFHRLFKDRYGMAPNELKRTAIALQNEIKEDER